VQEDGELVTNGQITAQDSDQDGVLTYSTETSSTYGIFEVDTITGAWSYVLDNSSVNHLAVGELINENFVVVASDPQGATASEVVSIMLVGANDPILIDSDSVTTASITTGSSASASGSINFLDPDLLDAHRWSIVSQPSSPLGTFTVTTFNPPLWDVSTAKPVVSKGELIWHYEADALRIASLTTGETRTENYTLLIEDGSGSSIAETVTVTISGANEAPSVSISGSGLPLTYSDPVADGTLIFNVTDPDGAADAITPRWSIRRWQDMNQDGQASENEWFATSFDAGTYAGNSLYFTPTIQGTSVRYSLTGTPDLAAGRYQINGIFTDEHGGEGMSSAEILVQSDPLMARWNGSSLVQASSPVTSPASAAINLAVRLEEDSLSPGGLASLASLNSSSGLLPSQLAIRLRDQRSGRLLATTVASETSNSGGPALLSLATVTNPTTGATSLLATANLNENLVVGETSRHYLVRAEVSGSYYNFTSPLQDTPIIFTRTSGAFAATTEPRNYGDANSYSLSMDIASSKILAGQLSLSFNTNRDPLTGTLNSNGELRSYLLTSPVYSSYRLSSVDTNADRVIDYSAATVTGSASLYDITTAGALSSKTPLSKNVTFQARFKDYDVTSETTNGLYSFNGTTWESRNGSSTSLASAYGNFVDEADFTAYRPGSTSQAMFSTNGYFQVKQSVTDPYFANQNHPNVLI